MPKRFLARAALLLLPIAAILIAWAFWWEPRRLVVRDEGVALPCWRAAPLRVAVVSDLHVGSPGKNVVQLDRVVQTINAGHPDLILLLGDFVIQDVIGGKFVSPEEIADHLRPLHAPRGVFAVLGNHDWWLGAPRVASALESAGVHVIDDRAVRMNEFWLAGVSDLWEGPHDLARALAPIQDDAPVVLITHNPDLFPQVPNRVCLTLAGHTHGGQVALPLIGRPIVPSRYKQRYAIGHVHERGTDLFVTSGVGTSIVPVRFRVPPEVVFLTISGAPRTSR